MYIKCIHQMASAFKKEKRTSTIRRVMTNICGAFKNTKVRNQTNQQSQELLTEHENTGSTNEARITYRT